MYQRFVIAALFAGVMATVMPSPKASEQSESGEIGGFLGLYVPKQKEGSATNNAFIVAQQYEKIESGKRAVDNRLTLFQLGREKIDTPSGLGRFSGERQKLDFLKSNVSDSEMAFFAESMDLSSTDPLNELDSTTIVFWEKNSPDKKATHSVYPLLLFGEHLAFNYETAKSQNEDQPNRDQFILCHMAKDPDGPLLSPEGTYCFLFDRVTQIGDVIKNKSTMEIISALQSVDTPYAMVVSNVTFGAGSIVATARPPIEKVVVAKEKSFSWENWFNQINAQTKGKGRGVYCDFPMDAASALEGLDKGSVVSFVAKVKQITDHTVMLDCAPHPR